MSQEQANAFMDHVRRDTVLLGKVRVLGRNVDSIIAFAYGEGFEFTAEEFMEAARQTRISKRAPTPEDLEALANQAPDADEPASWFDDLVE